MRALIDTAEGDGGLAVRLEPEEERLAMADPGFRSSSSSVRLDSFFADEVRFVEYNAESPAGMAYSDNLAAVFAQLPVMKAFRKLFRGRFLPTRRRQLSAMLRAFRQWDRGATPVVRTRRTSPAASGTRSGRARRSGSAPTRTTT